MKLPRRSVPSVAAGAAVLPAASRIAFAQTYPTRPVRLMVPFGAGGAPDILARLETDKWAKVVKSAGTKPD